MSETPTTYETDEARITDPTPLAVDLLDPDLDALSDEQLDYLINALHGALQKALAERGWRACLSAPDLKLIRTEGGRDAQRR